MVYLVASSFIIAAFLSANFYINEANGTMVLNNSKAEVSKMLDLYQVPKDKKEVFLKDFDKWIVIAREIIPFSSFLYSLFLSAIGYAILRAFLLRFTEELKERPD